MARSKEEVTAYKRAWAAQPANREKLRLKRIAHPEINGKENLVKRKSHLKTRYGITDAIYYQMLSDQDNGCAVCHTDKPGNGKGHFFDVDHDHRTGYVRGLLCRNCNVTLGILESRRALLDDLQAYLVRVYVRKDRIENGPI